MLPLNEEQRGLVDQRILKGRSVADSGRMINKKEGNIRVNQYWAIEKRVMIPIDCV